MISVIQLKSFSLFFVSSHWACCILTQKLCLWFKTLDRCGGIDILVSNAAVNPFFGNILDSTEEVWDKVHKDQDFFINQIM